MDFVTRPDVLNHRLRLDDCAKTDGAELGSDGMKLVNLDLNLLLAFKVLAEERHVSRAGQRIGLSQPAMSNALARLRAIFDDELLVRAPKGMQLTAKAMALAGPVGAALAQLEDALEGGRTFEPGVARRSFSIAMADYTALVLLPALKRRLANAAPNIDLIVCNSVRAQGIDIVERGEADLAIGHLPVPPPHMPSVRLFRERLVCMARADHPALRKRLTIKAYAALRHVQVRTANDPLLIDGILERLGARRRVELVVPHHLVIPLLVARTDLVATEPERLATSFADVLPLAIRSPPFASPTIDISMVWHSRLDRDPAHRWLRDQIVGLAPRSTIHRGD